MITHIAAPDANADLFLNLDQVDTPGQRFINSSTLGTIYFINGLGFDLNNTDTVTVEENITIGSLSGGVQTVFQSVSGQSNTVTFADDAEISTTDPAALITFNLAVSGNDTSWDGDFVFNDTLMLTGQNSFADGTVLGGSGNKTIHIGNGASLGGGDYEGSQLEGSLTLGSGDDTVIFDSFQSRDPRAGVHSVDLGEGDNTVVTSQTRVDATSFIPQFIGNLAFTSGSGDDSFTFGTQSEIAGDVFSGTGSDVIRIEGSSDFGTSSNFAQFTMGGSASDLNQIFLTEGGQVRGFADISGGFALHIDNGFWIGDITSTGQSTLDFQNATFSHYDDGIVLGDNDDVLTASDSQIGTTNMGGGNDTVDLFNPFGDSRANSFIEMGAGDDTVILGSDRSEQQTYDVRIDGGAGNDTFIFDGSGVRTTIRGYEDNEMIHFNGVFSGGARVQLIIDGVTQNEASVGGRTNGNAQTLIMDVTTDVNEWVINFTTGSGFSLLPIGITETTLTINGDVSSLGLEDFVFS